MLMVLLLTIHKLFLFFVIIFMLIFINLAIVVILTNTNTISALEKECCDQDIVLEEVVDAIKYLKCNKSPGHDGIAADFYKQFSDTLAPFLLNVFTESIIHSLLVYLKE